MRPPRSIDGERLIAVFTDLVEPLGRSLPASSEVVLHDLSRLPNSIVAIYGDVTGRRVGDPATNLLLEATVTGSFALNDAYETVLPDGRRMRSTTMIIRDVAGNPAAALCINTDISVWINVHRIADAMLGNASFPTGEAAPAIIAPAPSPVNETFVRDVEELASQLVAAALASAGVPVELMQKRHKLAVVRDLKARGMFLLRDAVEMVAAALQVTRFTIYNYLNELADDESELPTTTRKHAGE
ncbi:MAG: transcriptional regulator [Microbacterium sp.]|nr:MAG: transcriptional regulator [Microbacterium sp.]